MGSQFPSMKARRLRTLLEREFGYQVVRQKGSHRRMEAPGRTALTFAFHDGDEVSPRLVRTILVRDVGLTLEEAEEVVRR